MLRSGLASSSGEFLKQNPGWHRWLNPLWVQHGLYTGSYSVQLALSELAVECTPSKSLRVYLSRKRMGRVGR